MYFRARQLIRIPETVATQLVQSPARPRRMPGLEENGKLWIIGLSVLFDATGASQVEEKRPWTQLIAQREREPGTAAVAAAVRLGACRSPSAGCLVDHVPRQPASVPRHEGNNQEMTMRSRSIASAVTAAFLIIFSQSAAYAGPGKGVILVVASADTVRLENELTQPRVQSFCIRDEETEVANCDRDDRLEARFGYPRYGNPGMPGR